MMKLDKFRRTFTKQDIYDCTVVVLAYNAENFIADCLLSIESQVTNFNIKVLIHDDCSTDETVRVIDHIASSSKFNYQVITENENQFKLRGFDFFYSLLESCDSKYIAILDADDVWTASDKLETQIKLLEENPEVAISSHVFSTFSALSSHKSVTWPNPEFRKPFSTYADLAKENFIGTLTVVFRRSCLPIGLVGLNQLGTGDYPLWGLISSRGGIGFIDRDMAKYRIHSSQYFNSKSNIEKWHHVLDSKIFVANHTEGQIRRTWINAIENDVVQNYLNTKLSEDEQPLTTSGEFNDVLESTKVSEYENQISALGQVVNDQNSQIIAFQASWSWKVTKPLRRVLDLFLLIKSRVKNQI